MRSKSLEQSTPLCIRGSDLASTGGETLFAGGYTKVIVPEKPLFALLSSVA